MQGNGVGLGISIGDNNRGTCDIGSAALACGRYSLHATVRGRTGFIGCFNVKVHAELLDRELVDTLSEVKVLTERWRKTYKWIRSHSALRYGPPAPEIIDPRCG